MFNPYAVQNMLDTRKYGKQPNNNQDNFDNNIPDNNMDNGYNGYRLPKKKFAQRVANWNQDWVDWMRSRQQNGGINPYNNGGMQ